MPQDLAPGQRAALAALQPQPGDSPAVRQRKAAQLSQLEVAIRQANTTPPSGQTPARVDWQKPLADQDPDSLERELRIRLTPYTKDDELPYVASPFQAAHTSIPDPNTYAEFNRLKQLVPNLPKVNSITSVPRDEHQIGLVNSGPGYEDPTLMSDIAGTTHRNGSSVTGPGTGQEIYIAPQRSRNIDWSWPEYAHLARNSLLQLLTHEFTHASDLFRGEQAARPNEEIIEALARQGKLPPSKK
jgi:hypothetical protein